MTIHPRGADPFRVYPDQLTDAELANFRAMTPGEKIATGFILREEVLQSWANEIRIEYPAADDYEVRMRVAARHLPRDLMIAAYRWDPDQYGASLDERLQE